MKLNLNDESVLADGTGNKFDPSKIFGYSIISGNTIIDTVEQTILSGIEVGVLDDGTNYCDFKWSDAVGNTYNMREFEIDPNFGDPEKKLKSQITRLKHIVTKFIPEGTSLPEADTFVELCNGIKSLMASHSANTKPMRLKMVFNNKGYLTTPKYVPFVESMSVVKSESKLSLTDFDQLHKPTADNVVDKVDETAITDDLPF